MGFSQAPQSSLILSSTYKGFDGNTRLSLEHVSVVNLVKKCLPQRHLEPSRFRKAFSGAKPWRTRSRTSVWRALLLRPMRDFSLSSLSRAT